MNEMYAYEFVERVASYLSEQPFLNDDTTDLYCNEGLMNGAFAFDERDGICTERRFSYIAQRRYVLIVISQGFVFFS